MRLSLAGSAVVASWALSGCASGPPTPDWQMEAKASLDRSVAAYLDGNSRVASFEMLRARRATSSTGQVDLIARAELRSCAARVASLVFEPCEGFEKLRPDAAPAERAYADYLGGKLAPSDLPLLPESQRSAIVSLPNSTPNSAAAQSIPAAAAPKTIADALSILVASGAALQAGQASPGLVQNAVATASAQGWRRPLLAWLGVQRGLLEKAGDAPGAARVQRQIDLASDVAQEVRPSKPVQAAP